MTYPRSVALLSGAVAVGWLTLSAATSWPPAGDAGIPLEAVLEASGCVDSDGDTPPGTWPDWSGHDIAGGDVSPVRTISDPYPNFHGLAIDPDNDVVVMSDSNRHGLLLYERRAATADPDSVATPRNWVRGPATGMMFVSGVAVDPRHKEMFTVDNDIGDRLVTFPYEAAGNVAPKRVLIVPHQAWGLALDTKRDEIAMTVESANMIAVFKREDQGEVKPRRVIRGSRTTMADPHGIAWDPAHDEFIVVNHGNKSAGGFSDTPADTATAIPDLGFQPPSITVFAADGSGNVAPARIIQGDRTGLNWPMGVAVSGDEIAVGNHGDSSILVFARTAQGNVAPLRRIKGPRTTLNEPISVAFDARRDELWATNYNDHSAVVFDRRASGDVTPLRYVRNGPRGSPVSGFGNAGAVAYDSRRKEILVPN